ncbi:MAG TPA: carboxypeptidase-like regulatory domain-containing protein, partial [Acetobacteraceae bacterium]|nr:carboxypeptidase-like regulatory domain-containing protein [Acetobacteraceae bacterium]
MNRRTCAIAAAIFGILVVDGRPGCAQTTVAVQSETVSGVARDALQRPLSDVQVRLEAPDGRVIAHGETRKDGKFSLPGVAPGVYSLIGEKTGFAAATTVVTVGTKAVASDLTLASNQALNLKLTAERLAAARSEIEPRIGATTYTITQNAIQDQPGGSDIPLNQT